jgi:hypothetical protein
MIIDKLKAHASIILMLFSVFGGVWAANSYLAKADDLRVLAYDVQYMKKDLRYTSIQQRLWLLEDRYGIACGQCPQSVKEEYRSLLLELNRLKEDLKR